MDSAHNRLTRHELWDLRHRDPARLIAAYRGVANMEVDETLPIGVTYEIMIDAIVHSGRTPLERPPPNRRWR